MKFLLTETSFKKSFDYQKYVKLLTTEENDNRKLFETCENNGISQIKKNQLIIIRNSVIFKKMKCNCLSVQQHRLMAAFNLNTTTNKKITVKSEYLSWLLLSFFS